MGKRIQALVQKARGKAEGEGETVRLHPAVEGRGFQGFQGAGRFGLAGFGCPSPEEQLFQQAEMPGVTACLGFGTAFEYDSHGKFAGAGQWHQEDVQAIVEGIGCQRAFRPETGEGRQRK
ncbi:MAG TPA: hypothetical protein DCQ16_02410 [Spirochaetaceae bacterium]|nr:hypothetical protein [Spirochaetaceae bacterium]